MSSPSERRARSAGSGGEPGGIALARAFYHDHVESLLEGLPHAAALLGEGSEVLGFDDQVSTDHDFTTRVQVLVESQDAVADVIDATRRAPGTVEVAVAGEFFASRLGCDPANGVTLIDWLATPTQRIASLTQGAVFHDADGSLGARRAALAWYPDDVWRYVLAATWLRIAQHESFPGRTGGRGDELGFAMASARLVRDAVRLAFLIERSWAPYDKWLGTAFAWLRLSEPLGPLLAQAMAASDWREREEALVQAMSTLVTATNDLEFAPTISPAPRQYFTRDIRVLDADRMVAGLTAQITDPELTSLLERLGTRTADLKDPVGQLPGAIDQVTDNVDVLGHVERCRALEPVLMGRTRRVDA